VAFGSDSALVILSILSDSAPVHTTGINLESVITLASSIVVAVTIIIGGFLRQQSKAITGAVTSLADRLEARLETKDRVAELAAEIASLKVAVRYRNMKDGEDGTP
jgi:hypothetical protein